MGYRTLRACITDLEKQKYLVRIREEVDPNLEMAAIHRRVFQQGGPALLFENVKGNSYPAVSNLFGTMERCQFMFRDTYESVCEIIRMKNDPSRVLRKPFRSLQHLFNAWNALPVKVSSGDSVRREITAGELTAIKSWPLDGGAFITLPQVLTEDADNPGVMHSNLGMYRIQMNGNHYAAGKEFGLHYQIHRGIGVHQSKSNAKSMPLKVSIFVGGGPAQMLAAVMPLPEGMSELTFAGLLSGHRFRYFRKDGYLISADCDFVITGEVYPDENKPEGPFGDHLGYYSLVHDFPVLRIHKIWRRKDAVWPFTVVGRPPQEDTFFGKLIHEITADAVPAEVPGLISVHAVDAAGVHPVLLAIGSERYTPFEKEQVPKEILTIANHILGTGQMSLAKYLFIAADPGSSRPDINNPASFLSWVLERFDATRDLHFQTRTTIDTLDYSGTGLNSGSKVVIAAAGSVRRILVKEVPQLLPDFPSGFGELNWVFPGVLALRGSKFTDGASAIKEMRTLCDWLKDFSLFRSPDGTHGVALVVVCDDSVFTSADLRNFLWVTFTRSNPSHDIYGAGEFTENKHWGCTGSLVIDARIKPHHAPPLEEDPDIEKRVERLGVKGGSLFGII